MKILLLGHHECISIVALNLLTQSHPEHEWYIRLSPNNHTYNSATSLSALNHYDLEQLENISQFRHPFKSECQFLGIDSLTKKYAADATWSYLEQPNSTEAINWVTSLQPELIISIRYQKILGNKFIAAVKNPIINLHSGILPQYRGVMPTFWSMLNQETKIGASLHLISNHTIDTGALINTDIINIDYSQSYYCNTLNLYPSGCAMFSKVISAMEAKQLPKTKVQNSEHNYYGFPSEKQIKTFLNTGCQFF